MMRDAVRHLLTAGDHDDHTTARRAQELPENQPRPMTTAEIMAALRSA